jgi:hypothetical protein
MERIGAAQLQLLHDNWLYFFASLSGEAAF